MPTQTFRQLRRFSQPLLHTVLPLAAVLIAVVLFFVAASSARRASKAPNNPPAPPSNPWTPAQVVEPADLVKELANSKASDKPIVVCVGFRTYFIGAHVPGAVLRGPTNLPQGIDDLKKWAQDIPRSANLIVYCGCCPLSGCPNIKPAFIALRDMGFKRLRVLPVPNSFAVDWVEKGYPVEKGPDPTSPAH
jgi:thiosulfate/3-mercaptopyruvate sulfurtransferase